MIKFFRKIRQKLLTENKFNKNLLYTIGEIVQVVIDISIVIRINNRNQKHFNAKEERNVLETLVLEFDENLNILKSCLKELDRTRKK